MGRHNGCRQPGCVRFSGAGWFGPGLKLSLAASREAMVSWTRWTGLGCCGAAHGGMGRWGGNPEGSESVAGGRSAAETSGEQSSWEGHLEEMPEGIWRPRCGWVSRSTGGEEFWHPFAGCVGLGEPGIRWSSLCSTHRLRSAIPVGIMWAGAFYDPAQSGVALRWPPQSTGRPRPSNAGLGGWEGLDRGVGEAEGDEVCHGFEVAQLQRVAWARRVRDQGVS